MRFNFVTSDLALYDDKEVDTIMMIKIVPVFFLNRRFYNRIGSAI